jgi:type IV secretion system protein VirB5
MEGLLMGVIDQNARRYLPADMADIYNLYQGSVVPGYTALSSRIASLRGTISTLPPGFLPAGPLRDALNQAVDALGTQRAIGEASYRAVTDRIGSTENLISTIGSTTDEKGIAELAARIQGEQVLAQNEANRIALLAYQQRLAIQEAERRDAERIATTAKQLGTTTFTRALR